VGAGRVLLDYNPPLAGKTLVYEVTVQKKLETIEEQVGAVIHRRIPVAEQTKFSFTIKEEALNIEMPEEAFYLEGIQVAKRGIFADVRKFFPKITAVKFMETFKSDAKQEEKQTETEAEAKT
jgi:peptidylprolyl isomerase